MKAKHLILLSFAFCVFNTASAYTKDPTLCTVETVSWDDKSRTFKITNMPASGIKAPWCAYVQDAMWVSYTDITGTYIPGATIYTSAPLATEYGDPSIRGLSGQAFFSMAMFGINNNLPKPHNDDCSFIYTSCCEPYPYPYCTSSIYCDKFNATVNGSIITLTGLKNCVADNTFMYADDKMFSHWAILPLVMDQNSNGDKATVDATTVTYYVDGGTGAPIYPFAATGAVYMSSDDKGAGVHGSNYCQKTFAVSDIETPTAPTVSILPNPATPSETITIKGEYASDAKVSIISVSGAMVGSVIPTVGGDAMTVSLSGLNLQSGIYFVRIESGVKVYSGKLCVK
jgi:Secretion system C-terminal sorting domain